MKLIVKTKQSTIEIPVRSYREATDIVKEFTRIFGTKPSTVGLVLDERREVDSLNLYKEIARTTIRVLRLR